MKREGRASLHGPLERVDRLWRRHGQTFWILHSIWALTAGVVVLWLAHERYGYVPWVVGALVLTWASTLFFSRQRVDDGDASFKTRFRHGLISYLTRVMYQETLFFLLPFYAYSTVFLSWNVIFPTVLGGLAILSCLDLVFDRWLRESPTFGLVFFATVAFAALNLLLPIALSFRPGAATPLAAVAAVATAVPLAARGRARGSGVAGWLRLVSGGVVLLVVGIGLPQLIPPAPLRIEAVTFGSGIDPSTLELRRRLDGVASAESLNGQIAVVARVFSPSNVPARVAIDWYREGTLLRSSREVTILAHSGGFRVWDVLRTENGSFEPGEYRVRLRTADDRVFGEARVLLRESSTPGG